MQTEVIHVRRAQKTNQLLTRTGRLVVHAKTVMNGRIVNAKFVRMALLVFTETAHAKNVPITKQRMEIREQNASAKMATGGKTARNAQSTSSVKMDRPVSHVQLINRLLVVKKDLLNALLATPVMNGTLTTTNV